MNNRDNSPMAIMREMIHEETKYLRHYIAKVIDNSDPNQAGRVQVEIPELGWMQDTITPWCYPRFTHGKSVPHINEWVEVYFVGGNQDIPVYMGSANEIKDMVEAYEKTDPEDHFLFRLPESEDVIKYNEQERVFDLEMKTINLKTELMKINDGAESFVLGNAFKSWLDSFISWAGGHTHSAGLLVVSTAPGAVTGTSGGPVSAPGSLPTILSEIIKGK